MPLGIVAVQHVRRLRGGAQSQLMRCSDENLYVVKFQNNPQHLRVLVNEMLITRVAIRLGLPVPAAEIVEVGEWLIQHSPDMTMHVGQHTQPCASGLQFGSKYVLPPSHGQVLDWLPETSIKRVRNLGTFPGMLALDKWACNADGRQVIFWKRAQEKKYRASYIDHGYCFNAGEWTFPDSPLRGAYPWNEVYWAVQGWASFEPWLSRIEAMPASEIRSCADEIPHEWYDRDHGALSKMLDAFVLRRSRVRELISGFRNCSMQPFPNWV